MIPARLERKVRADQHGCLVWMGALHYNGYGKTCLYGKTMYAHRAFYELEVGPIPTGMVLDHLCRNRACVNVEHLEPVTQRENVLRSPVSRPALNARKIHCVRGHALTGLNLKIESDGSRRCLECGRACDKRRKRRAA